MPPAPSSDTPLDKITPNAHRKSRVHEADGFAVAVAWGGRGGEGGRG